MGDNQKQYKYIKYNGQPEPHWTDSHIMFGYIAWDETGAYPIGCYETKQAAKQVLIRHAKILDKEN